MQQDGYANASINRILACLKRAFNLAYKETTPPKVRSVPYIPTLEENNTRSGFFEHEQYLRLKERLPIYLKPVAVFGYYTGWRLGEVLNLAWDRVDLENRTVRLNPGQTKNKETREIPLNNELVDELRTLYLNRRISVRYVFTKDGTHKISNPKFHRDWNRACCGVGLKGKLFHDFRRTTGRNLTRAKVPDVTAMVITGHKTRSVFSRYNIVSDHDLKEAIKSQEDYIRSQEKPLSVPEEKVSPIYGYNFGYSQK